MDSPCPRRGKKFFGICFICSDRCATLDQTHKIKDIIIDVFGLSHNKQLGNKGYSTPMIAGTEHANDLAACMPYTPAKLIIAQKQTFAFGHRHVLGGCMHCALWTHLDILTACLVLVQYQASPGSLHFRALKHLVSLPTSRYSTDFHLFDHPKRNIIRQLLSIHLWLHKSIRYFSRLFQHERIYHMILIPLASPAATISFSHMKRPLESAHL
jgi:hypothetical protein